METLYLPTSLFYVHKDYLSRLTRKLISGVSIASSRPPISHLFFADDSLVFFKATWNCARIHHCLYLYEKASGQLINFEKSSLSFSLIQRRM